MVGQSESEFLEVIVKLRDLIGFIKVKEVIEFLESEFIKLILALIS